MKWKQYFNEVIRIKTTPNSIAAGFAIGSFIALLPTLGFGIFFGLIVIMIFPKLSKISMLVSFAVWNPLVLIPIYTLSYNVGNLILNDVDLSLFSSIGLSNFLNQSGRFIFGNLIVSSLIAVACFFAVRQMSIAYQKAQSKDTKEKE